MNAVTLRYITWSLSALEFHVFLWPLVYVHMNVYAEMTFCHFARRTCYEWACWDDVLPNVWFLSFYDMCMAVVTYSMVKPMANFHSVDNKVLLFLFLRWNHKYCKNLWCWWWSNSNTGLANGVTSSLTESVRGSISGLKGWPCFVAVQPKKTACDIREPFAAF